MLKPNLDSVLNISLSEITLKSACSVHCSQLKVLDKMSSWPLTCHINCCKSLGQSATCPRSSQLSQDQGSHPLITPPVKTRKLDTVSSLTKIKENLNSRVTFVIKNLIFFWVSFNGAKHENHAKWSVSDHQFKTGPIFQLVFRERFKTRPRNPWHVGPLKVGLLSVNNQDETHQTNNE